MQRGNDNVPFKGVMGVLAVSGLHWALESGEEQRGTGLLSGNGLETQNGCGNCSFLKLLCHQ